MERVQVELLKTLMSDHPEYVKLYDETGLMQHILPSVHAILSGKYARNALAMVKHAKKTQVLKYAALLNMVEPKEAEQTLKSLKLDNYTINTVTKIVRYSKEMLDENEPAVREAVHKYGKEIMPLLLEHQKAMLETKEEVTGITMVARKRHLQTINRMYQEVISRGDCIAISDLDITGNDLIEYGLKGPEIGKTLEELLSIVLENPKLNDKATLVALIEHL
jgi:tRNA nucleotidyltransferase (CCA-adding enzyme)